MMLLSRLFGNKFLIDERFFSFFFFFLFFFIFSSIDDETFLISRLLLYRRRFNCIILFLKCLEVQEYFHNFIQFKIHGGIICRD